MRVSGVRIRKKNFFELIFLSLVVSGVIVGSFIFQTVCSDLDFTFLGFDPLSVNSTNLILHFVRIFLGNSVFLLILFVCGFSAVLQPVVIMTVFVRGIGIGIVITAIYSSLGAQGVLNAFVHVVLPSSFSVFALVVAAREAFSMSVSLAGAIFSERNFIGFKDSSRLYLARFAVLEVIVALGSVVEILCNKFNF